MKIFFRKKKEKKEKKGNTYSGRLLKRTLIDLKRRISGEHTGLFLLRITL
jgi:hypothetical protein